MKIALWTERNLMTRSGFFGRITLFWGFLLGMQLSARTLEKSIMIMVKEERINDATFTHRVDTIDGKRKEAWAINGGSVNEDEYEESVLEAEKEERKKERKKEKRRQLKHEQFVLQAQQTGMNKLIERAIKQMRDELYRLEDQRLEPFLAFDAATISSAKELEYIKTVLIAKARELFSQSTEMGLDELRSLLSKLEEYPDRLRDFYYATVKNAQEQSDDTKLLKDLLSVVSQPL
jgi:hypothetical protein